MQRPPMTLSTIVLDAPEARVLADFYRRLLGWMVEAVRPTWPSSPRTSRKTTCWCISTLRATRSVCGCDAVEVYPEAPGVE